MSSTIDERVVEMRFDNKQFESGVQTTLSTLDKLKAGLNLSGAAKGLDEIESKSKSITMSGLSNAVETVSTKFSALEVMAVTALSNITNSAVNAGKRIVSSLTIEPVKTGFEEYETQINAVQTILANTESKGSTLDDVNKALDELNKYADMTIYNFTEMTRNIGTFTAAGVDLDTSVQSIKGIANLAAISGSSSQQASTAMYQLSQALASGTVKLQDWNSVVNAGMGGQVFQDALKRTATVMGTNVDAMIEKYGSFRESLTQGGWLTADVLNETLGQFAGAYSEADLIAKGYSESQAKEILKMAETATNAATKVKTFTQLFDTLKEAAQSGWTQSWEIIVGDFEEAKEMLTEVSDTFSAIINASSDARNSMLQGWKDLGGRTELIEALRNAFQGIVSVVTPIREAFREIFPPTTAEQLFALTKGLKEFTSHLKLSETQSANLKSTFKGLFAILDIGKQAFMAVWNAVVPLIGSITGFGDGILSVTGTFGDWLVNLDEVIKKSDIFNKVLQNLSAVIKTGLDVASGIITKLISSFKMLFGILKEKIGIPSFETFQAFLEKFGTRMDQVSEIAGNFKESVKDAFSGVGESVDGNILVKGIEMIVNAFKTLWNTVKKVGSEIKKVGGSIGESLFSVFDGANFDQAFDLINGGLFASILVGIKKFVSGFGDAFDEIGGVTENITATLDAVRGSFEAYQQNLQAKTLLTIASAIAILAASIMIIATIDSEKLSASLGAVTVLFGELLGSLALFSRMSGNIKGVTKTVSAMIGVSAAVLILASALKTVSQIDTNSMATGLLGVAALTAIIVEAAKALSKDTGKVMKGATSLVIFAAAIKVLASACEDLSKLSLKELGKGLTGVGALMAEVSLFLNNTKFSGKSMSTATGMVILAAAIKVLASACGDFASMEWSEIGKGLAAIGGLLTEIALFTNLTGNAKHVVSTGTSMVLLGASMKIFASAMKDFSGMSWDEIGRGLTGMAGALAAITIAVNLMPKNMVGIGVGLIAVSSALSTLADSLGKMGNMSWESIAKGLTTLGAAMAILAVGLNAMNGTLAGSAALIIAAGALAILTPTLFALGSMSWEGIAKGLIALGGAFVVIGAAGALLTPIIPSILALGGAFALIGVGVLAVGAGLLAAGAGLTALAAGFLALAGVGTAGATAIVAALTIIITGMAALIPELLAKFGEGIVKICEVLIASAPTICEAVVVIVTSIVDALVKTVPQIVEGLVVILTSVLQTLAQHAPEIIQAVIDILLACLRGIADNISKVIQAGVDIVIGFIDGVAKKLPDVIQAGFDLLISFINGITNAINENTGVLVSAIEGLILAIIDAGVAVLAGGVDIFKQLGLKIMNSGFLQGLKDKVGDLLGFLGDLIIKMKDALLGKISDFKEIGVNVITGFVEGIESKISSAIESVRGFAENIIESVKGVFDIHSPSRVFKNEVGKQLAAGLALGIEENSDKAETAAEKMAKKATEAAKKGYENFKTWMSDKKYYNELSLEEELYALQEAGKKYAKYADIKKEIDKEVYRVKNEIEEEAFNNSKQWMDNQKYYNKLTTEEELACWERLQQRYKEGTEKRIEADKEVYKLKNQLEQEQFNNSKEFIDDQKYYDKMNLKQELAAWKRIQKRYEEGTEQRKEADKEVYKLEKEYNSELEDFETKKTSITKEYHEKRMQMEDEYAEKVKSVNEKLASDIKSLEDQYESSIKSRADSIYGSFSLFDSINLGEDIDSSSLMTNLQDQVDAMSDWRDNLDRLANRGVDEGLIDELSAMGPSALKKIEALNSMSNSELDKYVGLWEEKHAIATERATDELEDLRIETRDKISQLKDDANVELDEYRQTWNEQMVALKEDTLAQLEELKSNWTSTIGDLSDVWTSADDMSLDIYETTGKEAATSLSNGISSESSTVASSVKEVSDTALSTMSENVNEYETVGNMVVDGFVKGIVDNKDKIISVMTDLVYEVINTVKETLDIHSPSRVMQSLGQFTGLGFINGLNEYGDKASQAGSDIGESAKIGLSNAISHITDTINSDIDTQPTIRPVLDLSNVESGASRLNTMFSRSQALSISTGMNKGNSSIQNEDNKTSNNGSVYQFTQNNYSPKALSRIEIYRQTKNQFSAMKGALG